MGHPVLRSPAAPIADPTAPELRALAADMVETMVAADGVGLAAPQIGVSLRLIVFTVPVERREPSEAEDAPEEELTILANPAITVLDPGPVLGAEGCLSIPGLRGQVPRAARIRYRGQQLDGSWLEREASGFHARVVQHEVDHLDGILYLDRMPDLRRLAFTNEAHHILANPPKEAVDHDR